jgi:hypothetical protein
VAADVRRARLAEVTPSTIAGRPYARRTLWEVDVAGCVGATKPSFACARTVGGTGAWVSISVRGGAGASGASCTAGATGVAVTAAASKVAG